MQRRAPTKPSPEKATKKSIASDSRARWIKGGLEILAQHGPDHLRIDRIAKALRITKGSFYHHFSDRAAFVTALLEDWEAESTTKLINVSSAIEQPLEKIRVLRFMVAELNHPVEIAFRAWGRHDRTVARYIARVDAKRMAYFFEVSRSYLRNDTKAKFMSELGYASFVGAQQLGILKKEVAEIERWTKDFLSLFKREAS